MTPLVGATLGPGGGLGNGGWREKAHDNSWQHVRTICTGGTQLLLYYRQFGLLEGFHGFGRNM
jgi:hypothetical protein